MEVELDGDEDALNKMLKKLGALEISKIEA
jgi:hypothetical protein